MTKRYSTLSLRDLVRHGIAFIVLCACAWGQQSAPRQPGFRISGTVVNGVNGQPLAQVRIFLGRPQEREDGEVVITGADGHFEFNGIPSGKYTLGACKP